ncbi:MAG TPA: DUF4267 domain-containing protein [Sphingomicrobium sp.]|jgi:hypothetical protein
MKRSPTLAVCLLSGVFLVLGGLFVAAPVPAAAFYGLPSRDPAALFYVRAIGVRDLALAAYLLALTFAKLRRALAVVLATTILIPVGDLALLASSGSGRPVHFLLHGASLLCFAGLALWTRRASSAP